MKMAFAGARPRFHPPLLSLSFSRSQTQSHFLFSFLFALFFPFLSFSICLFPPLSLYLCVWILPPYFLLSSPFCRTLWIKPSIFSLFESSLRFLHSLFLRVMPSLHSSFTLSLFIYLTSTFSLSFAFHSYLFLLPFLSLLFFNPFSSSFSHSIFVILSPLSFTCTTFFPLFSFLCIIFLFSSSLPLLYIYFPPSLSLLNSFKLAAYRCLRTVSLS